LIIITVTIIITIIIIIITIIGIPSNALKAYKAIYDIVKGDVDDVVVEFPMNKSKHSFLLDQKGAFLIKKISADTNVRILIPKDSNIHTLASLEGTCENVYSALNMFSKSYDEYYNQKKTSSQSAIPNATNASNATNATNSNNKQYHENNRDDDKGKRNQQPTKPAQPPVTISQPSPPIPAAPIKSDKKVAPPAPPSESSDLNQSASSVSKPVPENKIERKKEYEKRAEVIRMIEIPASIVGMLLIQLKKDKKERTMSVINKIQMYTSTRISRLNAPPEKVSKADADGKAVVKEEVPSIEGLALNDSAKVADDDNNRRRRVVSDDDDDDDEEEDDEDEDDDEDDDDEDGDDMEIDENLEDNDKEKVENTDSEAVAVDKAIAVSNDQVPFKIVGYSEDSVNEAAKSIERIVSGERINEVISNLYANNKGKKFPDFKSGKVRSKRRFESDRPREPKEGGGRGEGRGEGRGGRGRGRGGRGREGRGPPKSASNPKSLN